MGPSNVGKTVFLTRAYSLLGRVGYARMLGLGPTEESKAALRRPLDTLENKRDWPEPTVVASQMPFSLYYGLEEVVRFNWLDLPGAVFTNPDSRPKEAETFDQHLLNADAVAMLVDAEDLATVSDLSQVHYAHVYYSVAKLLYTRLKKVGVGARPVPLSVIITKSCRVNRSQGAHCAHLVRPLMEYWCGLASQSGLPAPPVRVFLSSAVVTRHDQPNDVPAKPLPLTSEQCVEPIYWLAAKTMRANVSLLEFAAGFNARSPLQEMVLRLEALVGR